MDAVDSGDESDHKEMLEDIRDESQSIQTLIGEKHVIKYVVVLRKYNRNGKVSLKLHET